MILLHLHWWLPWKLKGKAQILYTKIFLSRFVRVLKKDFVNVSICTWSNMSHPTSKFPYVLKMLSPRKICTIWAQHHNHNPENLSLERSCCALLRSAETDSSPSFYWHRDSDCELWGQIFPLKKEEKKENRKPLIFVSWGMCKNEWDLSQISVFCRHCLSLSFQD